MQLRPLFLPFLALIFLGAARAPDFTIRFHAAASKNDGPAFAALVNYGNPPHSICIKKVPEISERDIEAIWPFPAGDGTMGCMLKLNDQGRLRLTTLSTEIKGKPLVCMVNKRLVTALLVDRQVTDGLIPIPAGLSAKEIETFLKQYRVMGEKKKK